MVAEVTRRRSRDVELRVLKHAGERVSVMVIKVWREEDTSQWRARITQSLDVATRDEKTSGALIDDVVNAVKAWLREVTGQSEAALDP